MLKGDSDIIIANITTWPKRDMHLFEMLSYFKKQTLYPDKIILWLSNDEYDKHNLPESIKKTLEQGLITEIKYIDGNTYAHKKWETFKINYAAYNVMIDDDICYPTTFVEELYAKCKKYNLPATYYTRTVNYENISRNYVNLIEKDLRNALYSGLSMFPPFTFPLKSFKYKNLRDTFCYRCDDSWINTWLIKENIPIIAVHEWPKENLNEIKGCSNVSTWVCYNSLRENGIFQKCVTMATCAKILKCESLFNDLWPNFYLDKCANTDGISICIAAYKAKNFIKETLDSIASQTYFNTHNNYEILLGIDNCDETLKYVKTIMHRYKNLKVLMFEKNMGTFVAANTLFSLAKYNYCMRFDADDMMSNVMIEKIMTKIHNDNHPDVIRYKFRFTERLSVNTNWYAYGSICIKKSAFNKFGGYKDWRCAGDKEFFDRIDKFVTTSYIDEPLYYYRYVDDSLTHAAKTKINSSLRNSYLAYINDRKIENEKDAIQKNKVTNKYKKINSNIRFDKNKYIREEAQVFIMNSKFIESYFGTEKMNKSNGNESEIISTSNLKQIKCPFISPPSRAVKKISLGTYNPFSKSLR